MKAPAGSRIFWLSVVCSLVARTFALGKDRLYPYDGSAVLEIETNGMVRSAEIRLHTPIKLYDQEHDTVYVNGNGVISFYRPMDRFFNIPFPLDDPSIVPLYTHVDIRASGAIYYKETNASEIVSRAGGIVRSVFKDARDFVPTNVFLTTWLNVGYYNEKKDKVNTFQSAISSNGTHSYVEFLYPENGIQWIRGESHPNGLPDAIAQAGIIGENKFYALPGSGTDQIQNIDKWSNVHRPGHWIMQIGPITDDRNIKLPEDLEDNRAKADQKQTCRDSGSIQCHTKATCMDYEKGFCCACKQGYFGNGKSCLINDVPIRIIGKAFGKINDHKFEDQDLQSYIQTKDGRSYTALARLKENIADRFQLLSPMSEVIGWLFAKPVGNLKNGYQLTGGVLNHTADMVFESTNDRVTIHSRFMGLDVFGQLKVETEVKGYLPFIKEGGQIDFEDYEITLTRSQPGTIRSNSKRTYKYSDAPTVAYNYEEDHTIHFGECSYAPADPEMEQPMRLKFSRGMTMFEKVDGIVRFAMNSKIGPLEEEDPCVKGRATCGPHSLCVADKDTFRCVCDHGYQMFFNDDGSSYCTDVNECNTPDNVCSRDAICVNRMGGFTCTCKPGFVGDGQYCDRLDTCENTVCDSGKECIMTGKSPICACPQGFEEVENKCIPMRQRATSCDQAHNCSPLATCDYSQERQSYVCTCAVGYLGDGYTCYPDTEVGIVGGENPVPSCERNLCWCPVGWEFLNRMCVREENNSTDYGSGEVLNDHECQEHQDCVENERCTYVAQRQRYECTCQPGYSMINGACMTADCGLNPSMCHANGQCVSADYNAETYQCVCVSGYVGDGIHQCVEEHISCNEVNNCGRNAVCGYDQASSNYTCLCLPGYDGDGYDCIQQAVSCQREPSLCSRDATCSLVEGGEFACVCNDGFFGDGHNCRPAPKQETNFLLVNQGMATHKVPFYSSLNKPGNSVLIAFSQMAVALDIDCPKKRVFLSDVSANKIQSMSYNGSKVQTFVSKVATPEGIAVDWISRVVFWTDPSNKTIEVAHLETKKRKVLFAEGLHNPRGIAVHPFRGKIFWTDWNRASPKIETANEDGSGRLVFLQDRIKLPNSLAIDWYSEEICWTDAGSFSISCANIDSKNVRVIVKDLTYPFGLAISPENFYWTDWKSDKIGVASRNTGEKRPAIPLQSSGSGKLYGIVFVPEACPRVSNVCQYENGRCSADQLCLPDGQGSRTCVCADNSENPCSNALYYQ